MSTFGIVILCILGIVILIILIYVFAKKFTEIANTRLVKPEVYSKCNTLRIDDEISSEIKNLIDVLSVYLTIYEEHTNKDEYYSKLSLLYKKILFFVHANKYKKLAISHRCIKEEKLNEIHFSACPNLIKKELECERLSKYFNIFDKISNYKLPVDPFGVEHYCYKFGSSIVFFFKSLAFAYDFKNGSVTEFNYSEIKTSLSSTTVQVYSQEGYDIAYHRWRYQRVDGGPDRRYNGNYCTYYAYKYSLEIKHKFFSDIKTSFKKAELTDIESGIANFASEHKVVVGVQKKLSKFNDDEEFAKKKNDHFDEAIKQTKFENSLVIENGKVTDYLKNIKYDQFDEVAYPEEIKSLNIMPPYDFKPRKITFPKTLVSLDAYRINKENLEEVVFQEGSLLSEISYSAFEDAYKLKTIKLPQTIKKIGFNAFEDCISLKEINLPSSIEEIASNAFNGCSKLEKLYQDGEKYVFKYTRKIDLSHDVFKGTKIKILHLSKRGLDFDDIYALKNNNFESVYIYPNYNEKDLDRVFSLDIPDIHLLEADDIKMFDEEIEIPSFVKYFEMPYSVRKISAETFSNCKKLETLIFKHDFHEIDKDAFKHLKNVTIKLPEAYRYVDQTSENKFEFYELGNPDNEIFEIKGTKLPKIKFINKFSTKKLIIHKPIDDEFSLEKEFPKVESIEFNYSSKTLGDITFENLKNLKSIKFPKGFNELKPGLFKNCISLEIIEFPFELVELPDELFCGCSSLKSIKLDKVKKIGKASLYGCTSLNGVTKLLNSLDEYAPYCFAGCNLKSIAIGSNIKKLPDHVFDGCKKLSEVKLPDEIEFGEGVFEGCEGLKDINFLSNKHKLTPRLFANCSGINSVALFSETRSIPNSCFEGCQNLKSVDIPDTLKVIGERAFYGCKNLKRISGMGYVSEIDKDAFTYSGMTKLVFPTSLKVFDEGITASNSLKELVFTNDLEKFNFHINLNNFKKLETIYLPKVIEKFNSIALLGSDDVSVNLMRGNNYKVPRFGKNVYHPMVEYFDLINKYLSEAGFTPASSERKFKQ